MNTMSIFSLDRLSIGVSRLSIRPKTTYRGRPKKMQPELTKFPPGWGEQIWLFNHIMDNHVIYSHRPIIKSNRGMRQLPFNGKKTKPAKLRKDYWRPMAMIQFPKGEGVIGQSVFQKLREFRMQHELCWGHQTEELYKMSRKDRGRALNDQKANSIADMAAVLGGAGRGNRIWIVEKDTGVKEGGEPSKRLAEATVYWADGRDREYAQSWSENITHELGLPSILSRSRMAEELLQDMPETAPEQAETKAMAAS